MHILLTAQFTFLIQSGCELFVFVMIYASVHNLLPITNDYAFRCIFLHRKRDIHAPICAKVTIYSYITISKQHHLRTAKNRTAHIIGAALKKKGDISL